jgi:hypothetical protein
MPKDVTEMATPVTRSCSLSEIEKIVTEDDAEHYWLGREEDWSQLTTHQEAGFALANDLIGIHLTFMNREVPAKRI